MINEGQRRQPQRTRWSASPGRRRSSSSLISTAAALTDVQTGVPFFDHMLDQLGRHGCMDLTVRTRGDTEVDAHHTVEDTAIALGQALAQALGDKAGICRFGDALVPLDETLARAAVDLSGRPYVVHSEPDGMPPLIGTYDTTLTRHFFESLAAASGICVHLSVLTGRNPHHIVEAQFKAIARALASRCRPGSAVARHSEHEGRAVTGARPRVVVLDYGSGNLRSAQRALQRVGADAEVTADFDAALNCRRSGGAWRRRVRCLHGRAARGPRRHADRPEAGRIPAGPRDLRWHAGDVRRGCGTRRADPGMRRVARGGRAP